MNREVNKKPMLSLFIFVQSKTVISMLPNNDIVKAVYTDADGVFAKVQPDSLLVDCSTIDPIVAKDMSEKAKAKGAVFCDAPVSGGVNAAKVLI